VIAEAADGPAALDQLRRLDPEVAVVDHDLPGIDGARLAAIARREGLSARVVILATGTDGGAAFRAVSSGAAAFLIRNVEIGELRAAMRAVATGRVVLPPAIQTAIAAEIRLRHDRTRPALSTREREVLALVAGDCTIPTIASRLQLSVATVKTHLQHVYGKLDARDRAAAVAAAFRLGLLE
jgi:two-component system nitrate/nitrite response regulator NarL